MNDIKPQYEPRPIGWNELDATDDSLWNEFCVWAQADSDTDLWETSCGRSFRLDEGTPAENNMKWCCFCSKPLEEHPWVDGEDAAPQPEPVAWYWVEDPWGANEWHWMTDSPESQECDPRDWTPVYLAPPAPMSEPNRLVAYSAAKKLRDLGYDWDGDEWKLGVIKEPQPAMARFLETAQAEDRPLERLRYFCSLAMSPQDWLDVESLFDACEPDEPQPEPLTPEQRAAISPAALRRYDEAQKAAPQTQRQPLTDEQWYQSWLTIHRDFAGDPYDEMKAFVRAIEAAHGIGVKK